MSESSPEQLNEEANLWTREGISLLEKNSQDSIFNSILYFNHAIEIRQNLPLENNIWYLYGLIAGWMNRGDALRRLKTPENLQLALESYDQSILLLKDLPMEQHTMFRKRHAIAWSNRGLTLQQMDSSKIQDAISSFNQSISILSGTQFELDENDQYILACAWMNRANSILQIEELTHLLDCKTSAQNALYLIGPLEKEEMDSAEVGFKSRHIFCQSIVKILDSPSISTEEKSKIVSEATDTVEEGMALSQHWEKAGAIHFRPMVSPLFQFGAKIYQTYQPHFLAEFLLEQLDPHLSTSPMPFDFENHVAALKTIWEALCRIHQEGFKTWNRGDQDHLITTLRNLRIAESRLKELTNSLVSSIQTEPILQSKE